MPMTQRKIKGRAHTPEEKRAIVERLLKAWERVPHLRLGQLLENSGTLFYTEDEDLAAQLERFAEGYEEKQHEGHYVYHVTPGGEDEIDAILDSDEPPPQKLIDLMKRNK